MISLISCEASFEIALVCQKTVRRLKSLFLSLPKSTNFSAALTEGLTLDWEVGTADTAPVKL